jgi:hypothetical protein
MLFSALIGRPPPDDLETSFRELNDLITASNFAELASRSIAAKTALLAEIQSYERVIVLAGKLDDE